MPDYATLLSAFCFFLFFPLFSPPYAFPLAFLLVFLKSVGQLPSPPAGPWQLWLGWADRTSYSLFLLSKRIRRSFLILGKLIFMLILIICSSSGHHFYVLDLVSIEGVNVDTWKSWGRRGTFPKQNLLCKSGPRTELLSCRAPTHTNKTNPREWASVITQILKSQKTREIERELSENISATVCFSEWIKGNTNLIFTYIRSGIMGRFVSCLNFETLFPLQYFFLI